MRLLRTDFKTIYSIRSRDIKLTWCDVKPPLNHSIIKLPSKFSHMYKKTLY